MKITTIGIDLAKAVFQIHGVDERGKVAVRKQLKRAEMSSYFANLEPCLIGMEACGSAHHWARKLEGYAHTVKLMAPQFVKPYVKTNKNDMADAEAICEAVSRPNMRFVAMKTVEQQAILSVHRARQGFVKARTAQGNQIRGLLSEFGVVIPQGIRSIMKQVPEILEDGENGLPGTMRNLLERLTENLKEVDRQARELEAQIQLWHRENAASRKLAEIPGLGPITASAIVATVGDAREFKNGRQLAAWMGLVGNPLSDKPDAELTQGGVSQQLAAITHQRQTDIQRNISERNARFFEEEADKLDGWADDLKVGLEREIKEFDRQIKEARRAATTALTLEEKLAGQKQIKTLEGLRNQKRRTLFDAQDQVDKQREELIAAIEGKMNQSTRAEQLFSIRWTIA